MPIISQQQFQELPPNEQKYYSEMMNRANQYGNEEYKPYQKERIANEPKEIKRAHESINNRFAEEVPLFENAHHAIHKGAAPFHENYHQYMNPYQDRVIKVLEEEGNRNFRENVLPALEARFFRLGQHGGSRHKEFSLRAARDFERELLNRQSQALASGYQQAAQLYNAQQARELESANQLSNLASSRQASRLADIAALENAGRYRQQQEQALLDAQYQEYLRQIQHPMERLQFQAAMMHGMPSQAVNQAYYQTPATPQMNIPAALGPIATSMLTARMMGMGNR